MEEVDHRDLPRTYVGRIPLDKCAADVIAFLQSTTGVKVKQCKVIPPRAGRGGTHFARVDTETPHDALLLIARAHGVLWDGHQLAAEPVIRGTRGVRRHAAGSDYREAIVEHVGPAVAAGLTAALGDDATTLAALAAYPCYLLPYARAWAIMSAPDATAKLAALLVRALWPLHPRSAPFIAKAIMTGQTVRDVLRGAAAHAECYPPPTPEVILEATLGRDLKRRDELLRSLMRAAQYESAR